MFWLGDRLHIFEFNIMNTKFSMRFYVLHSSLWKGVYVYCIYVIIAWYVTVRNYMNVWKNAANEWV